MHAARRSLWNQWANGPFPAKNNAGQGLRDAGHHLGWAQFLLDP